MYYYPSVCSNMNASACVGLFPMQDCREKYFVNDTINNGNEELQLNGQQLRQLQNHQMMNTSYGKRSRCDDEFEEEENYQPQVRKSISDGNLNINENSMVIDEEINQEYLHHENKRHFSGKNCNSQKESEEWPIFQHPDGGIIQFTPHGNVRTYFDDAKGIEISVMDNNSTLMSMGN